MHKISYLAGLLMLVVGLSACNKKDREVGDMKTRESGLQYQYFRLGEEQKPDSSQLLVMHMTATTATDSVLFDTRTQGFPMALPANDPNMKGLMAEGIKMLHKGDSAQFIIPAKDFYLQTASVPVPQGIDENGNLKFNIGVVEVTDEEGYRQMQMDFFQKQQEQASVKQRGKMQEDLKVIDQYLAERNIVADTTESGVRIQVTQKGSGNRPQPGDNIVVHYRGKLLDGTPFDASYDRNEPFTFPVGQGMVIRGWDEGLLQLPKGSKATLYIPSPLAYGDQQRGEVIRPNSILVFDVEILDIAKQQQ